MTFTKEELRSFGTPRVHPNGFIQLDYTKAQRIHFWHPSLPYRQKTFSPVHDHIFDFDSEVLVGRLINLVYEIVPEPEGTHERWQVTAIEGENTVLQKVGDSRYVLYAAAVDVTQPGGVYTMEKYKFHETLTNEPTMTIMTKSDATLTMGPNCQGASVMCPFTEAPDNDFRRDAVDPEVLWKLIDEVVDRY